MPRISARRLPPSLRQLRELFASTGFGDIFEAPPDFPALVEGASSPAAADAEEPAQSYAAGVLDLLLELTTVEERPAASAWPPKVIRARNAQEAIAACRQHGRFDVVVIDDVMDIDEGSRREIEQAGALTHRTGLDTGDTVVLEIPHRQTDAAVAAAASGQPNRWLGSPAGVGIVVRSDPTLSDEEALRGGRASRCEASRSRIQCSRFARKQKR
ncbi:hypothetical protein ACVOMS_21345 [Bradyrhizobium guangxiense]